ncbi:MAG: DUF1326 domain-containing protein [Dehalococcoidia bacterium]
MVATQTRWQLSGDYFENCNCDVVCPCLFSPLPQMTAMPTAGACEVAFGFHVNGGRYGEESLDGLNVGLIGRSPGAMGAGNWSVALYLDERATQPQREALQAIFTGAAGGTMSNLAPLIGTVLGVKAAPITWKKEGKRRSLEIPGIMHIAVHAAPGLGGEAEILVSGAHPFASEGLAMAVGDAGSTWEDYGMRWDNSGKNGHYAAINWSNG